MPFRVRDEDLEVVLRVGDRVAWVASPPRNTLRHRNGLMEWTGTVHITPGNWMRQIEPEYTIQVDRGARHGRAQTLLVNVLESKLRLVSTEHHELVRMGS